MAAVKITNLKALETKVETPNQIKSKYQLNSDDKKNIIEYRKTISNILNGSDKRLLVITGPCSIHDEKAAYEYANFLKEMQELYNEHLFL